MDGTLTATLQAGSGDRTVTSLSLTRSGSDNIWNTITDTRWALGAAASLDGVLYNAANASVNFVVLDGGSFKLFASDSGTTSSYFPPGATMVLTANFLDGSSATASATIPTPPAATLVLAYNGKVKDRVGRGDKALTPDGSLDGTLTVTLQAGSGNRTVTSLTLTRSGTNNKWNTTPDSSWVLGAAGSLDGALYNASNATVNFNVVDGASFNLFAADAKNGNGYFPAGATLVLTANFADGSSATTSTVIPSSQ
jgi:hypothetical protein